MVIETIANVIYIFLKINKNETKKLLTFIILFYNITLH